MFKWDRLLRRSKIPKDADYLKDEAEEFDIELNAEEATAEDAIEQEEEFEIVEMEVLPNKIICPDCGGITLEGLEFCDKCGGEI